MGQGAWILMNTGNSALASIQDLNPFFIMLPEALRPVAVIMSTAAAIIASQALITGSYTLVSEAINLDLLPHLKISYPSETKGQLYIGAVNTVLMIGCTIVVLYFRSGAKIEHAYGLCITLTMLMDTLLLTVYMLKIRKKPLFALFIPLIFGAIESVFFISSLAKFTHGGYFAAIMASIILSLMIIWYRGTQLEHKYNIRLQVRDYLKNLKLLHEDEKTPICANNLVYIDRSGDMETLDRDILYSILDKDPKRADAYWFFSIHVLDEPDVVRYSVETFGTDHIFRVKLELGFKNDQLINVYIRQIVADLLASGELPAQEKRFSIYGESKVGTFKFCILRRSVSHGTVLSRMEESILNMKYKIREIAGSQIDWYGLKNSSLIIENVPLSVPNKVSAKQTPVRIK
jgi:KUP system potassium uptake protein